MLEPIDEHGKPISALFRRYDAVALSFEVRRLRKALRKIADMGERPAWDMRDIEMATIAARALEGKG